MEVRVLIVLLLFDLFIDRVHRKGLILLHHSEGSLAARGGIHHVLVLLTVLAVELANLVAVIGETLDLIVVDHYVQVLSS
jgi:hypothetical protein